MIHRHYAVHVCLYFGVIKTYCTVYYYAPTKWRHIGLPLSVRPKIVSNLILENRLSILYTHVCDHNILIKFDSHGNCVSHLWVTALYLQKTTWKISCLGQTSTLLGALASNIHRCLSYMWRLSWIIIMALSFCGKKSEVGASVSYGHISSSKYNGSLG